jgi:hypothetical protein
VVLSADEGVACGRPVDAATKKKKKKAIGSHLNNQHLNLQMLIVEM